MVECRVREACSGLGGCVIRIQFGDCLVIIYNRGDLKVDILF